MGGNGYFRRTRGKRLSEQIASVSQRVGRPIRILDVGGRSAYWSLIDTSNVASITAINLAHTEIGDQELPGVEFESRVGDACDLGEFAEKSFDLAHANSVIEHVGGWDQMAAMASEMKRVADSGWCQTPAWGFPFEPHFRLPVVHWLADPMAASMLRLSPPYRLASPVERRKHVDRINLLTRSETARLFPDALIDSERVVLVKSHIARWGV